MKKNNGIYIKRIISISIIILFFIVTFKYFDLYMQNKNLPITVSISAKVEQDDNFQLFYTEVNSNNSFNEIDSIKKEVKKQKDIQTIKFYLPVSDLKSLSFHTGTRSGEIIIKDIKLKNIIHTYTFSPENIVQNYKPSGDISKFEIKDEMLYINSIGKDPNITNLDIVPVLKLMNSNKIIMIKKMLTILLCIVFSSIIFLVFKLAYRLVVNYKKISKKFNEISQNFIKYKHLLWELVKRDIKVKYKRSYLGILWSVLNPLLMMIVITIVFSSLFRFDIPNFTIYLLTGQICFNFFSEATNMAMGSIIGNGSLIKKVYIPKYIFPTARVLSSFVNLLFSLVAIIIMLLITRTKITWIILLFPIPLLYLLIFSMGIGLILAAYAVFFRDIVHLYGVLLTAWMYITPIFYPANIIPPQYQILLKLNPLYYLIEYFRDVVLYSKVPSLGLNLVCISISVTALIFGLYVFYRNQNKYILYI